MHGKSLLLRSGGLHPAADGSAARRSRLSYRNTACRAPGVSGDTVVDLALRPLAGRRHRITDSGRDEVRPHPTFIAAKIDHFRRVRNIGMSAISITVFDAPLVEIVLRLLRSEEHTSELQSP